MLLSFAEVPVQTACTGHRRLSDFETEQVFGCRLHALSCHLHDAQGVVHSYVAGAILGGIGSVRFDAFFGRVEQGAGVKELIDM
jgi:hypothetical protein